MKQISIRELKVSDIPDCERILRALPEWFGIESANQAYLDSLRTMPACVAEIDACIVGFLALAEHNPASVEIHVMAVDRNLHRNGIGRALLAWVRAWCRERNVAWLHVKTRGPSTPDPNYERTRRFYVAQGFEPLFESPRFGARRTQRSSLSSL
jgi:GNAT superfamily N-acetyltransferase